MTEIKKEFSCAVTGHRKTDSTLDKNLLKELLEKLAEEGCKKFYVGMALGFDTLCFQILEEIKKEKKIEIIACVPCVDQDKKFSLSEKKEYKRMLSQADEIKVISEEYTPYCMMKRNIFMVDNSSVLVAYLREDKGGTKNTVEYAKKEGKKIIYV